MKQALNFNKRSPLDKCQAPDHGRTVCAGDGSCHHGWDIPGRQLLGDIVPAPGREQWDGAAGEDPFCPWDVHLWALPTMHLRPHTAITAGPGEKLCFKENKPSGLGAEGLEVSPGVQPWDTWPRCCHLPITSCPEMLVVGGNTWRKE